MNFLEEVLKLRTPRPKFDVLPEIKARFSPRVFSSEKITELEIKTIFEAARLAPSARFNQPWIYHWAQKGSIGFTRILNCLPERNRVWAQTANLLVVTSYTEAEPVDGINKWAKYDLGAANMSMVLQAQKFNIYCRQIGSFEHEMVSKEFTEIPIEYKPFVILAFGKIGTEADFQKMVPEILEKEKQLKTTKERIDFQV